MINYKGYIDKISGCPFIVLQEVTNEKKEFLLWNSDSDFLWFTDKIKKNSRVAREQELKKIKDMTRDFPISVYKVMKEKFKT